MTSNTTASNTKQIALILTPKVDSTATKIAQAVRLYEGSAPRRDETGFTIIELLAVVAILSILAVVALSAYSDYVVRSKIAEGLGFATEAKTSVTEYYYSINRMPTNNEEAGLPPSAAYADYDFIESLDIITVGNQGGVVEVVFAINGLGADNVLHLRPSTSVIPMSWLCTAPDEDGVANERLPPACRTR